jgi:cytochrome P450
MTQTEGAQTEERAPGFMSENATTFPFDPTDPVFRKDPYPTYNALRENAPVMKLPLGLLVLSRHADCVSLLHSPHGSTDQRNSAMYKAFIEAGGENPFPDREPSFLVLDPPDHTRLRGLVQHAFTPRRVREMAPRIQQIVDELIDAALARGSFELIDEFAYLVPVKVICELLGIPPEDHEIFRENSRILTRGLDPDFMVNAEDRERMMAASKVLDDYFEELIAERTRNPGDDLLSALIQVEQAGDKLTHEELRTTLGLLLIAGHETTVNLIGNGILQLSRHPDSYRKLCDDPSLARGAVEETLRYDPPVQVTGRIAMIPLTFGDDIGAPQTLDKGDQAICLIGAVNRDPAEFGDDAQSFDISRKPGNHIAFGGGIHFCLGAPLARLEAQIAFETFSRKIGPFRLASEPAYREHFVLRGMSTCPLEIGSDREEAIHGS